MRSDAPFAQFASYAIRFTRRDQLHRPVSLPDCYRRLRFWSYSDRCPLFRDSVLGRSNFHRASALAAPDRERRSLPNFWTGGLDLYFISDQALSPIIVSEFAARFSNA